MPAVRSARLPPRRRRPAAGSRPGRARRQCRREGGDRRGNWARMTWLLVEQAANEAADQPAAALALSIAAGAFLHGRVEVGALDTDPAGPGEAIEDQVPSPAA